MKHKFQVIISNKKIIISIYFLLAILAGTQALVGTKVYRSEEGQVSMYNNYEIFARSFDHLVNGQDLYKAYPKEHWDLFKYTPTFSALFGVLSILPDWIGLNLWNLLNVLVLAFAIYFLPKLNNYQKGILLLIILLELLTSVQNEQSNGLIAGLIIMAFGLLERNKNFWATLMIVLSVSIKLFGIVGFALFLLYPKKGKSILYTLFWLIILGAIPLLFIDFEQYTALYQSYFNLLSNDHDASYGYSVMGIIHSWFSVEINKNMIVGIGAVLFLIPFLQIKKYKDYMFRILALASVLLWIIIFNHKAESPTFIIAMSGVAIWFMMSKKNAINTGLFALAFILTSLSPTEFFPKSIRNEFVRPYCLKALPCVLIWIKVIYDMIGLKVGIHNSPPKETL
ncbi:MAG: hypothetical protein C0593_02675 [Marinilabiliales bacterium]|nr:MAG: hypothetical protein C0593_02675 [Marinilabiliales bacterium]